MLGGKTMKDKIISYVAKVLLNMGLKWLLSKPNVQDKQKQVVKFINTLLDATRDMKLSDDELETLKQDLMTIFKS